MPKGQILVIVAMVAILGAAVSAPGRDTTQDDLKTQVAKLRREVAALKAVMGLQEKRLTELNKLSVVIATWFHGLPNKVRDLSRGLEEARELGFASAGANPKAREVLLDSVKSFGADLGRGIPQVEKKNR